MSLALTLETREERFPLAQTFTIARGSKTEAVVVTVTLRDAEGRTGRGECVPYGRYGESITSVLAALESIRPGLESGAISHLALPKALPPGAARNALDCAFWDLRARQNGTAVWRLAGLAEPAPRPVTASTISIGTPDEMAAAARALQGARQIKVKLGRQDGLDLTRLEAVRQALPEARLLVDLNEGWTIRELEHWAPAMAALDIACLEQPLPANDDAALAHAHWPVPIIADESCHTSADLPGLIGKYSGVNIKLDKTGGLTEALRLLADARQAGMRIMVGCMVASSLAIAPAFLLAAEAEFVDLDGAALLAKDRISGMTYKDNMLFPAQPDLWG